MIFRSTVRVHLSRKWELNHYKLLELFFCDLKTWSQGEQDVIMGEDTHHQAWWIFLSPWTPLGRRKQRIWRQVQSSDLRMHAMAHVHACVHVCVRACIKVKKDTAIDLVVVWCACAKSNSRCKTLVSDYIGFVRVQIVLLEKCHTARRKDHKRWWVLCTTSRC